MLELGIPVSDFSLFLFMSTILCMYIVIPSEAMQSAGFTIPVLFSSLLGQERFNFVDYHLRRTLLTIFIHASLPFFCFIGLHFYIAQLVFTLWPQNLVQMMARASLLLSAASACVVSLFYANNWQRHFIVRRLQKLNANSAGGWREIAQQINMDVRQPMIFSMTNKECARTLVTPEWILHITNYNVHFARIADSQLLIVRSSPVQQSLADHPSNNNGGSVLAVTNGHLIDLRVQSISGRFDPFHIRIRNEQELNHLREEISRPIEVLDSLVLPKPLHERFVDVFVKELERNPRFKNFKREELEPCLGCSQTLAEVKLAKQCVDSRFQQEAEQQDGFNPMSNTPCQICACRPMWCARCIGRIFASKQDQTTPELWMAGRAPCPTCRALFCVLDVCHLAEENN